MSRPFKIRPAAIGDENFCASIQKFLDETVVRHLASLKLVVDADRLCLAGGVTANVITNLKFSSHNYLAISSYTCDG